MKIYRLSLILFVAGLFYSTSAAGSESERLFQQSYIHSCDTIINGIVYSLDDTNHYACVSGFATINESNITLDSCIMSNGEKYIVHSINDSAFFSPFQTDISRIVSIDIPASVKTIGRSAFKYLFNLNTIIVHWTEPRLEVTTDSLYNPFPGGSLKNYDSDIFPNYVTLSVPSGCINEYMDDKTWNIFGLITDGNCHLNRGRFIMDGKKYTVIKGNNLRFDGFLINSDNGVIPSVINLYGTIFNVTDLCADALKQHNMPSDITLPRSVVVIPDSCFWGTRGLVNITIPETIETIGDNVFSKSKHLSTININWTDLSKVHFTNKTFNDIPASTLLRIPDGLYSNYIDTFPYLPFQINVYDGKRYTNEKGFIANNLRYEILDYTNKTVKVVSSVCSGDINIPTMVFSPVSNIQYTVVAIGEQAFKNQYITSVYIPETINNINSGAFEFCQKLSKVIIDSYCNTAFDIWSGCFNLKTAGPIGSGCNIEYKWNDSIPNGFFCTNCIKKVILPFGLKSLPDKMFQFSSIEEVEIPNTVQTIGNGTFWGCSSLKNISIPKSVITIGDDVFHGCQQLETVSIPAGLKKIGKDIFAQCPSITDIFNYSVIPQDVNDIYSEDFESVFLHILKGCKKIYESNEYWKKFNIIDDL